MNDNHLTGTPNSPQDSSGTPAPAPTPTPTPTPVPSSTADPCTDQSAGKHSKTPPPSLPRDKVEKNIPNPTGGFVVQKLEAAIRSRTDTEYESDKAYRDITKDIIDVSKEHLEYQRNSKNPLRQKFFWFFSILLSSQYIALIAFIVLDSLKEVSFCISESLLKTYIVSVFAETLSAMAVMLVFAFASKEETQTVGVLNNIVKNYQKVHLDSDVNKKN